MKGLPKTILPYAAALLTFLVVSAIYFYPFLEGKRLNQSDMTQYYGMSKEIRDYKETNGEPILWTNSMFSGMPTYLISTPAAKNLIKYFHSLISLNHVRPISFLFVYLLGFYLALLLFGVDPWLSMLGALAYGFSTYFLIIIGVGHTTKVMALGYMPVIVAGVYYALNKKILLGAAVTGFFLALQLLVNHLQITYYTLLIILILGLFQLVVAIRKKEIIPFGKNILVLLVAVLLAVGTNITNIWTTLEYGNYSTRGESELTGDSENKTTGLDKDYILNDYSYGLLESFNLFIPNFVGGSHSTPLGINSETYDQLRNMNVPNAKQIVEQFPAYWGPQRSTAGPVYLGAVVIFLFFFGAFYYKHYIKWWLVVATILAIALAWGKHFMPLSDFFIDYVPGYNKFRTVSMILVIAAFTAPLLGFLGLNKLIQDGKDRDEFIRALKYSVILAGGIALLFSLFPGLLNFRAPGDQELIGAGWPADLVESIRNDRKAFLQRDAFRSLVFVLLTAGLLLLVHTNKIKKPWFFVILGLLILVDLWTVDRRFVNDDDFRSKRETNEPYLATQADQMILQDSQPYYRVLDLTASTFNSTRASYFHKSIGGYHGAKMKKYQELIEFHISGNIQDIINGLQSSNSQGELNDILSRQNVLNMLNTKYVIYNGNAAPLINQYALGNAWFVNEFRVVETADDEIAQLEEIDPKKVALVHKQYSDQLEGLEPRIDSGDYINLQSYHPDQLTYESKSGNTSLAVFSDIFYDRGWQAYIDGEPVSHFRVDFTLRGLVIPEGSHQVEFRFRPQSYYAGEKISLASSFLIIIIFFGIVILELRKWWIGSMKRTETNTNSAPAT